MDDHRNNVAAAAGHGATAASAGARTGRPRGGCGASRGRTPLDGPRERREARACGGRASPVDELVPREWRAGTGQARPRPTRERDRRAGEASGVAHGSDDDHHQRRAAAAARGKERRAATRCEERQAR